MRLRAPTKAEDVSLGTFVAGAYSGTYVPPGDAAGDLGIQEKGYELSVTLAKQLITDTDDFAQIVADAIYQGAGLFLSCVSKEWKSSVLAAALPYGLGAGLMGRLDTNAAGTIILASTAGTTAALAPAIVTAPYALIAEGWDVKWMHAPEHRKIPMRFRIYPHNDGDQITFIIAA
jgi:hypothetical protein